MDLSGVDKRVSFQLADERRELRFEGRERGGRGGGGCGVCTCVLVRFVYIWGQCGKRGGSGGDFCK